jgi:hypothetical protein
LRDAGIELANNVATANGANDEPGRDAGDDPRRQQLAAIQDGLAKSGDRCGSGRSLVRRRRTTRLLPSFSRDRFRKPVLNRNDGRI